MSEVRPWEWDWSAIAAGSAAVVALYGAWRANKIASRSLTLSSEMEVIKFREAWINQLRSEMANFAGLLASQHLYSDKLEERFEEINQSLAKIQLLLNPKDPDYDKLNLIMKHLVLNATYVKHVDETGGKRSETGCFSFLSEVLDEDEAKIAVRTANFHFIELCQVILKREWTRIISKQQSISSNA